jgi:hypothetical protein
MKNYTKQFKKNPSENGWVLSTQDLDKIEADVSKLELKLRNQKLRVPLSECSLDYEQEMIHVEDFGFYTSKLTKKETGIDGVLYICDPQLYCDDLGPRIRYYPDHVKYIHHISPYSMDPVFFDPMGYIRCYDESDGELIYNGRINNIDILREFIDINLDTLLKIWNQDYDNNFLLRDHIKAINEIK